MGFYILNQMLPATDDTKVGEENSLNRMKNGYFRLYSFVNGYKRIVICPRLKVNHV
jgi:hypothetical protein